MADSKQEILAEMRKAAHTLKKHAIDLELQKIREKNLQIERDRVNNLNAQKVSASLAKSMTTNERGERVSWHQVAQKAADEAINLKELTAYIDARSAMSGMVANIFLIAKAIHYSCREVRPEVLTVEEQTNFFKEKIYNLKNRIFPPEILIPSLHHRVCYSDVNGLNIQELELDIGEVSGARKTRSEEDIKAVNANFNALVHFWLRGLGYEIDRGQIKKNNITLTESDFNNLKNDPNTGLKQFLEEHVNGILFEESQKPVPAPAP